MKRILPFALGVALILLLAAGATAEERAGLSKSAQNELKAQVTERLGSDLEKLLALYKEFHTNPELSLQEEKTAARLAREMKELGYEVTTNVGGHGIVAVYKNGDGPTILVRTDMDALPVLEKTGLPYASKIRAMDRNKNDVPVMHACGHDMNMTCAIGVARVMKAMKDRWKGTLIIIGQPAEEIGAGARMMLADGLYKRFPKPDYCLALHCDGTHPHGHIAYTEGLALANVDSVEITVKGKGGHGAAPHTTIDPIVIAARIVLDLQTIVSREVKPTDPAVVTVGSIHGGTKHNIIPNDVKLQITVRTTKDEVRDHVLKAIKRIAKAAAEAGRAPEPEIKLDLDEFTPALLNDKELTRKTVGLFKDLLGPEKIHERPPVMGGEDFSRYGKDGTPIFLYFLGTITPEQYAESLREGAAPLPSLHSDQFYPIPKPTIETGVLTMSMAVLNLFAK
jgi:hippurate hydrolase